MNILVTGGAGYIGSHTCLQLLLAGHQVVVFDNLCNSQIESFNRVRKITEQHDISYDFSFVKGDIRDESALKSVFSAHKFDAVIHFAGLKAVGESSDKPLLYYANNVNGSIKLFSMMAEFNVKNIVFSSSATVYGGPHAEPITENYPLNVTNPYGRTKLIIEDILHDMYSADPSWRVSILRYFNPIGAHESGLIGENPNGIPNNLLPYVAQVAVGRLAKLRIFGNDYETPDGTGVRDYVHVMDLADGHVMALNYLFANAGLSIVNLGTGVGYSVLDVVNAFSKACGKTIDYEFLARRAGDVDIYYADVSKAQTLLGWQAKRDLMTMCADTWRWQSNNPNGY